MLLKWSRVVNTAARRDGVELCVSETRVEPVCAHIDVIIEES